MLKIEKYVERAKNIIESIKQKKRIEKVEEAIKHIKKIRKKIEEKLEIKGKFLISSDYPQNDEDIEILKKVLEIDEKIVYLTDNIEKVKELQETFPEKVCKIDEDLYLIAFVVDIHIYFWDNELSILQKKYNKVFNPIHPTKMALNKPTMETLNFDLLKFMYGKRAEYIKNIDDIGKLYFGEALSMQEIKKLQNMQEVERLLYMIEISIDNTLFVKALSYIHHKAYIYSRNKNKVVIMKSDNNIFINNFLRILS